MTENEIILTHILKCTPLDLILNKPELSVSQDEQYRFFLKRRQAGEPLQYILGTCNFMGLELTVTPDVLIPRPETEQLVDWALKDFKGSLALDLGTGSGNIAIALAKFVAGSRISTVDISLKALEIARVNALLHGVDKQINFIQADILAEDFLRNDTSYSGFDLIISNPPYIPKAQIKHLPLDVQQEPQGALDGGEDGLDFYRAIIKNTRHLLRRGGCLMIEFGDGQALAIKTLLVHENRFNQIDIIKDLSQRDRIIRAISN